MSYIKEFDETRVTVPAFLLGNGWEDVSWHDDACPRFESKKLLIAIWVDYDDPDNREMGDTWKKFHVIRLLHVAGDEYEQMEELFATNDQNKLHQWLHLFTAYKLLETALRVINGSPKADEAVADELTLTVQLLTDHMEDLTN